MPLNDRDLSEIARAKDVLEHPSIAIRLTDLVGTPIEALVKRLPQGAHTMVVDGTQKALTKSLDFALRTLDTHGATPSNWLHRGIVMATGAAGGFAGLAGIVVELPISLTVMLRSIADNARAQGEDLSVLANRMECLTVFAYGSASRADDAADAGYFMVRAALAQAVSRAAEYVTERGVAEAIGEKSAPAIVQLVARIAQRLGVAVTDKAAAQLVPVIGAAGGAAINALFISHFQNVAWAHFTVRRLERSHGSDVVRGAYDRS